MPQEVASACDISHRQRIIFQASLPTNTKQLEVHCKFGSEDLKSHFLNPNQEYVYDICKGSVENVGYFSVIGLT